MSNADFKTVVERARERFNNDSNSGRQSKLRDVEQTIANTPRKPRKSRKRNSD
jgi:hypothetical protein